MYFFKLQKTGIDQDNSGHSKLRQSATESVMSGDEWSWIKMTNESSQID